MGLFVICGVVIRAIRSIVVELFIGRICATRFWLYRDVLRCPLFLDDIGRFFLFCDICVKIDGNFVFTEGIFRAFYKEKSHILSSFADIDYKIN
jgi:hypothetical protein